MSDLQDAIDTLADGDLLREMTRHNAADFVNATAIVVEAARLAADGQTKPATVIKYCRDLPKHKGQWYEPHECETWWFEVVTPPGDDE